MTLSSHTNGRLQVLSACALALGCLAGGCADNPVPTGTGTSTLNGSVRYSGGGAAAGALIAITPLVAPPGADQSTIGSADAQGIFTFTRFADGDYIVYAAAGGQVAADTAQVRANSLTSVHLILAVPGVFRGMATLEGGSDHRDIFLTVRGVISFAGTDSLGEYLLGGIPTGSWTTNAEHSGYDSRASTGTITTPGDTVFLAPMELPPTP